VLDGAFYWRIWFVVSELVLYSALLSPGVNAGLLVVFGLQLALLWLVFVLVSLDSHRN
jgi:hypothetical protein